LINKTTATPLNTTDTYAAALPSIAANWRIAPTWSAYAQIAKGYLAPPISVAQVTVINTGLKAEETTNYQLGSTWKSHNMTLSGDIYYIDFDNFLTATQIPGTTESTYINSGGVIYEGVELEGQYAVTRGFSLYGNYSYNSAKYKGTEVTLAEVPEWIAAAGVLYDDRKGPYFSLIGKFVGPRFGDDGTVIGAATLGDIASTRIKADFTADLAIGYHLHAPPPYAKQATISLKVANILNNRQVSDFAGYQSVGSANLYWRNAGISAFLNLDAKF
jgi:iron complex outermembrane receptor protein